MYNIVFEIYTQYSIVASSISFRGVADINKLIFLLNRCNY